MAAGLPEADRQEQRRPAEADHPVAAALHEAADRLEGERRPAEAALQEAAARLEEERLPAEAALQEAAALLEEGCRRVEVARPVAAALHEAVALREEHRPVAARLPGQEARLVASLRVAVLQAEGGARHSRSPTVPRRHHAARCHSAALPVRPRLRAEAEGLRAARALRVALAPAAATGHRR